jgi:hypothetical protein
MGRPSHDALATELFPAPRSPLLEALPSLGAEATQLLEALELRSTLTIAPSSTRDQYLLDHRLVSATFPGAARPASIDLVTLGAPALVARFVPAIARQTDLEVGTHGFTLRLGSAARLAFGTSSLVTRGGPRDVGAFVAALFTLASRNDGGTILTGCPALDALLCADLGEPRGCLLAACSDGLAALRKRLDAGFEAMDGDDLDFVLGGTAPVVDADGDGQADVLGGLGGVPGLWPGELRGRAGPNLLTGTWAAIRVIR